MSKKDEIIKIKKPNIFAGLKYLTNWMLNRDRKIEDFQILCKKFGFDKSILKRIISYSYNSPHTIWYINKYMNDLYKWDSWSFENIINSLLFIFEETNILNSKKFFYVKNNENKDLNRQEIINLFDKYFQQIYDKRYNNRILRFFYQLYLYNIITTQDIINADKTINNGKKTILIKESEEEKTSPSWDKEIKLLDISVKEVIDSKTRTLGEIQSFIDEIENDKKTRDLCRKCNLFDKKIVVLDTNLTTFPKEKIDVVFIGLNPGAEEAKMNQPFTAKGKSGKLIRDEISKLPENSKWLITNIILCSTKDGTEIGKISDVAKNCSERIVNILNKFPAKLYVLIGSDSAKEWGFDEPISKISGIYNDKRKAIPVIHPSGIRNLKTQEISKKSWLTIYEKIKENLATLQVESKTDPIKEEKKLAAPVSEDRIVDTDDSDDSDIKMFFDCNELSNGKILLTFIDKNGKKTYEEVPYELTSYIKDSNYTDCTITSEKIDYIVKYNRMQKFKISQTLKEKLNELKKV